MKVDPNWLLAAISFVGVLLVPTLAILIRGAIKWTKTEGQVSQLVVDVDKLVNSKEKDHQELSRAMHNVVEEQSKVHREIYEQMRSDREATDRRLRFIEEYWMKRGQGTNQP